MIFPVSVVLRLMFLEQQGDAPQCGDAHDGIDHAADQAGLTAADERYQVKLKKTDGAPVKSTDDDEHQGYFIKHFFISSRQRYFEQKGEIYSFYFSQDNLSINFSSGFTNNVLYT